jgi:hypothetical protein
MTQHAISGLIQKRAELAGELERIKGDLRAIDRALETFGYFETAAILPKRKRRRPALFKHGELFRLVCDAEREGLDDNPGIARWIMERRGWGEALYERVWQSVKHCRKPSAGR